MKINKILALGLLLPASLANAQEQAADSSLIKKMEISIYNNNLALVKDTREINFNTGENLIAFEGVANTMNASSVRIKAPEVSLIEQNYEYSLMNPAEILEKSVGQEVKTALYNDKTGQTTFSKAKILDAQYGSPILQFDYGIETAFPGRVIYEKLPEGLRRKPTLAANLNSKLAGTKMVELAYLAGGMGWSTDYVADVASDDVLNLNALVTLTNNSGVDLENANVQLISGQVNSAGNAAPMMMRAAKAFGMDMAAAEVSAAMPSVESFSDYYLYTLPVKTTLKDKQTKQVSLFNKEQVKYEKKYVLQSPALMYFYNSQDEFKKLNPNIVFKLKNVRENNLGEAMPSGIVRFYKEDSTGKVQFLGESIMQGLAVNDEAELVVGKSFDIFANIKNNKHTKLSDKLVEKEYAAEFNNGSDKDVSVDFEQYYQDEVEMVSETIVSNKDKAHTFKWTVNVPAKGKTELGFKVRIKN